MKRKLKKLYTTRSIKKDKRTKSRLNRNTKMLLNRGKKILYVQVKEKNTKS